MGVWSKYFQGGWRMEWVLIGVGSMERILGGGGGRGIWSEYLLGVEDMEYL